MGASSHPPEIYSGKKMEKASISHGKADWNVVVPAALDAEVEKAVQTGHYSTKSEVIRAGVRELLKKEK